MFNFAHGENDFFLPLPQSFLQNQGGTTTYLPEFIPRPPEQNAVYAPVSAIFSVPEVEQDSKDGNEEQYFEEEHRARTPVLLARSHLGAHTRHNQNS